MTYRLACTRFSSEGRPLPKEVRGRMESFFEADFSEVRIHLGAEARAIGALAFASGSDIFVSPSAYNPSEADGQRLLVHELTHVMQQRGGRIVNPCEDRSTIVPCQLLEAEAELMAWRFSRGLPSGMSQGSFHYGVSKVIQPLYNKNIVGFITRPNSTGGRLTGISYGEDMACALCSPNQVLHAIYSDTGTYEVAQLWVRGMAQNNSQALKQGGKGFMVAVMYAGGHWMGAVSGNPTIGALMANQAHDVELLNDLPPRILSRGGIEISQGAIAKTQRTNVPFSCAGPRLVAWASYRGYSEPWYMTEVWYDPNELSQKREHGQIIQSCPTCQILMPFLMCPMTREDLGIKEFRWKTGY